VHDSRDEQEEPAGQRPLPQTRRSWVVDARRPSAADTTTFTYSDPMLFTVGYGPSGRPDTSL